MIDRRQIEAHLEFFRELGVEGVSRDPAWRSRAGDAAGSEAPAAERPAAERPATGEPAPIVPESDVPPTDGVAAAAPPVDVPARGADREPRPAGVATPPAEPGPVGGPAPLPGSGAVALSMFDQVQVPAEGTPKARLERVREQLGPCTRCKLHAGRTTLVFGVGNPDADLMFVGEAPGRDEDREGIPFVGRAGQLLTRIIEAIDLRRDDVYIANVIKCRPPDNRNPEPDEVRTCEPYLFAQIDCIRPRVIVALGSFAARTLLRDDRASITRIRGQVHDFRGARLIPTFHPAFLLRSPERKREVWEDMKLVRTLLATD